MEQQVAAVRRIGFLGGLRPALVDEIVWASTMVRLAPSAETVPVQASIVVSGLLAYSLWYPNGRQITIRYVTGGDLIGSLASPGASLATGVQAIEPSLLLRLDAARLQAIARREPELSTALIEELTQRLRSAYRTLASRSFGSVTSRVAGDLVARARASGKLQDGITVIATREALADATGSVREVVARSLNDLRTRGLIEPQRGRVTILDVRALAREADLVAD